MAKPQQADANTPPSHRVMISDLPGGRFAVRVEPELTEGTPFDQTFDSHRAARGYAGGIRMTRGFAIRDLTVFAGGETEQVARP